MCSFKNVVRKDLRVQYYFGLGIESAPTTLTQTKAQCSFPLGILLTTFYGSCSTSDSHVANRIKLVGLV